MKMILLLGSALGALFLTLGLVIYFSVSDREDFSDYPTLPAARFLDDPALSHHGNAYSVQGTVVRQLEARSTVGRLIVIEVPEHETRLPLLLPAEITDSLYVNQRYQFFVRVEEDLIRVERMRRL